MLSVNEARARLLENFHPLDPEILPIDQAAGRVLAVDITATQDLPPFANSSMDGYAVRCREVATASREHPVSLRVSGDIPAGSGQPLPLVEGTAARIMTGAPVPEGAEAVVPVEDTDEPRDQAHSVPELIRLFKAAPLGANVRPVGQDIRVGQLVLPAGTVLRPAAIGVLAALGIPRVEVYRRPHIAIFSTGDELCELEAELKPGQIRDTNSYAVAAAIESYGGRVLRLGIARDQVEHVQAKLQAAGEAGADLILSSAGVSVGAYDVVKAAVEAEGKLDFWRVRMRPGKPLAFGNVRGTPFVGLPGNPVSALVCFEVFVRPALLKMGGHRRWEKPALPVTLLEPMHSDGRESYLRVIIERQGEGYVARSTGDQGSAVLTSLVQANGLLIIPENVTEAPAGSVLSAWVLEAWD